MSSDSPAGNGTGESAHGGGPAVVPDVESLEQRKSDISTAWQRCVGQRIGRCGTRRSAPLTGSSDFGDVTARARHARQLTGIARGGTRVAFGRVP